jgi:phage shock protein A
MFRFDEDWNPSYSRSDMEGKSMTTNEFHARLAVLKAQAESMPESARPALDALIQQTIERHHRLTCACRTLHESVEDLRLAGTYLRFDLEATRRENRMLQARLHLTEHPENREEPGDASEPSSEGAD